MNSLVLVDSSAWIQSLRRQGDAAVRARVQQLLSRASAAWCDVVRLELWNGARGEAERQKLSLMESTLPRLPLNNDVWDAACNYAAKARRGGLMVPATDLVIFACAKVHAATLEHVDRHFDLLDAFDFTH